jgi:hypothetical protein
MNRHLLSLFDFMSTASGGDACTEAISLHGYPADDFQLFSRRLEEIQEKFGHSRVTFEAYTKCRDYLNEIKDSKEVCQSVSLSAVTPLLR